MKSLRRLRPVIFISCILLVVLWQSFAFAQDETSVAGIWSLSAQGVSVGCTEHTPCQAPPGNPNLCGTAICGSFQMGDPHIHVSQSDTTLSASEGDINGILFSLAGNISGTQVTFTIVGNGITPGIGNATTNYIGTLSGDNITGNFSGFGSWSYPDANGNLITETATWTGTFTVTIEQTAVIDKILGIKKPGLIIGIIGTNFGDTQSDSMVHIGRKTFDSSSPRIKFWTDTEIRIRLPNYQCGWFKGRDYRYRRVWVTVDGVDSNKKRIKILKPSTCP